MSSHGLTKHAVPARKPILLPTSHVFLAGQSNSWGIGAPKTSPICCRYHPFGQGSGERVKREFGLPHLIRFPILPELSEAGDGVLPAAPAWELTSMHILDGCFHLRWTCFACLYRPVEDTSHA